MGKCKDFLMFAHRAQAEKEWKHNLVLKILRKNTDGCMSAKVFLNVLQLSRSDQFAASLKIAI